MKNYKTFWDYVAGTGGLYQMGPNKYRVYILDKLKELGVKSVLEEGCGTAPMYDLIKNYPLNSQGTEYTGWDFSYKGTDFATEMIKVAKEHFPEADLAIDDARHSNEKSNSFDCVLLIDTIDHLDNYQAAIKEAARITKKYVIISLWRGFVGEGTNLNSKNMMNLEEGDEPWEDTYLQEYSQEVLETEFKKNKLKVLKLDTSDEVHDPGKTRSVYILQKGGK